MFELQVKTWVVSATLVVLVGCGGDPGGGTGGGNGATGGGGGSSSTVKPADCTLSATVEEFGNTGSKAGRASGTLTCPGAADLELSVCIQSSMTMTFTDGPCATGSSTATSLARSSEASFLGTRNVRAFVRGRVNGVDLPDATSNVISITR